MYSLIKRGGYLLLFCGKGKKTVDCYCCHLSHYLAQHTSQHCCTLAFWQACRRVFFCTGASARTPTILLLIAFYVFCWFITITANSVRSILFFQSINGAIRNVRMQIMKNLHNVPLHLWRAYGITEVISATTRISTTIRNFMGTSFTKIFPAILKFGTFSVAIFHSSRHIWYCPLLALCTSIAFRKH